MTSKVFALILNFADFENEIYLSFVQSFNNNAILGNMLVTDHAFAHFQSLSINLWQVNVAYLKRHIAYWLY